MRSERGTRRRGRRGLSGKFARGPTFGIAGVDMPVSIPDTRDGSRTYRQTFSDRKGGKWKEEPRISRIRADKQHCVQSRQSLGARANRAEVEFEERFLD